MSGTYKIEEVINHPTKFACRVSFNDGKPEYFEVETPSHPGEDAVDKEIEIDVPVRDEQGRVIRDKAGKVMTTKGKQMVREIVRRPDPVMGSDFVHKMLQKAADEGLTQQKEREDLVAVVGGIKVKNGRIA